MESCSRLNKGPTARRRDKAGNLDRPGKTTGGSGDSALASGAHGHAPLRLRELIRRRWKRTRPAMERHRAKGSEG